MSKCIVTFDQPLYAKAVELVYSADPNDPISSIFVRLGGFHLLMSFLGSIGFIMAGSGLEEAFETVYAPRAVIHIMNGHAYERALRAHFLAHLVLTKLILDGCVDKFSSQLQKKVKNFMDKFDVTEIDESGADSIMDEIESQFQNLSENSRTAELWLQYWKQITILKYFIRAERTGDFELHLYSIKLMIPYFHAAGHLQYAKYAQLYLEV